MLWNALVEAYRKRKSDYARLLDSGCAILLCTSGISRSEVLDKTENRRALEAFKLLQAVTDAMHRLTQLGLASAADCRIVTGVVGTKRLTPCLDCSEDPSPQVGWLVLPAHAPAP